MAEEPNAEADRTDAIERAICRETCAMYGEPPCWEVYGAWPNPDCDEPGCHALAQVADAAVTEFDRRAGQQRAARDA